MKGWVKALTEDLQINQKNADDKDKKAVMMNDLAYHHIVMSCTNKAFFMSRWHKTWKRMEMQGRHGKNMSQV